jgi:hypothetical protein
MGFPMRTLGNLPQPITEVIAGIHRRDRFFFVAVAAIGLTLVALQWAGGAWKAEFDGHPDESAQFVTGRMIWEYLSALPHENPISWAGQYYLHYPKVALGHWPPGYHLAEAFWSSTFGSSRSSAMGLQWFIGLAALTGLYTLVRPRLPLAVTAGIILFAIATPVFQEGLEQTMSDLCCLLCSVLLLHAALRLLTRPDRTAVCLTLAALFAAAITKGTAACLVPVPLVALLANRQWLRVRWGWPIAAALAVMAMCLAWYLSTGNVLYWGGVSTSMPWPVGKLGELAGWGFVALAALGLRREPLPILAGAIALCAILVSFALRAMNEPRHWIIVLPAVLVLAGYAVTRLPRPVAGLSLVAAVGLFPWLWYHQAPAGYHDLVRQLHLPARMLVSSARGAGGEGAWIAEVSVAERYPASLVARASKVLAESGWNGEHYKLQVQTPWAVARRLDELAIDVVVLDAPSAQEPPHHALLGLAVTGNSAWRRCGSTQHLTAYCRSAPPAFPRVPLVLDAGGWHFEERFSPAAKAETLP